MKHILILLFVLLWSILANAQVIPPGPAEKMDYYEIRMWQLQPGQVTIPTDQSFETGDTLFVKWQQGTTFGGTPTTPPFVHTVTGQEDTLIAINVGDLWDADTAKADLDTNVKLDRGPWALAIRCADEHEETGETIYSNWGNVVYIYLKSELEEPVLLYIQIGE